MEEKKFRVTQGPGGFVVEAEDGEQKTLFAVTPEGVTVGGVDVPPLLCGACKTLFRLNGKPPSTVEMVGEFRLNDDGSVDWNYVRLGPCPTCGGKGVVRQALFDVARD
ncbi:MAG: hypothetical protein JWO12_1778, partial [Frankiales bacterium]|nr:hypothetical protein [Frankiales bacterium]